MKKWLAAAGILLAAGLIIGAAGLFLLDFDLTKLSTETYVTNTTEINGEFTGIHIDSNTANIRLVPSEDGTCRMVSRETEKEQYTADLRGGTLIVEVRETRRWWDFIGISFESGEIVLHLPDEAYDTLHVESDTGDVEIPVSFQFTKAEIDTDTGDVRWHAPVTESLSISTDTGSITVEELSPGRLKLETDTGRITLRSVQTEGTLEVDTDTGDVHLTDVLCHQLKAESSTGDIRLERFDASSIRIETDTGDVTGTLLTEKTFVTDTATGRVRVPNGNTGGRCEIRTSTGDIELAIQP